MVWSLSRIWDGWKWWDKLTERLDKKSPPSLKSLEQRFSIQFEACTPSGRKNRFRTPCTCFIKKWNRTKNRINENTQNVCRNLSILHPKQDFASKFDKDQRTNKKCLHRNLEGVQSPDSIKDQKKKTTQLVTNTRNRILMQRYALHVVQADNKLLWPEKFCIFYYITANLS